MHGCSYTIISIYIWKQKPKKNKTYRTYVEADSKVHLNKIVYKAVWFVAIKNKNKNKNTN